MALIDIDNEIVRQVANTLPEKERHRVHVLIEKILHEWLQRPVDPQQPPEE